MVGRCFLNFRPFLSLWLFSATYSSPCWAPLDIRDTSSPWSTTSCSERTNTSLSSSSRFSISLMTRWRSSTSKRRRRAASNSMLELGVTSLEEGAVAEVEGGSEPASRAPVTLRKSPMEIERLVAGDARARRAEADPEGGMANGGKGGGDGDDGDDASGCWRSACGSGLLRAAVMSSAVSSLRVSVFLCRPFIASFELFPCCCRPCRRCWCFPLVVLCQRREPPSRACRDVLWCSLGTAPFINKRSEPGLCRLCVWVVVLERVPLGISLAAELMSMSADDWAASPSAADAGRLSCPLLDYFASSSSSSSGVQLWSAQLSEVRDAIVSGLSLPLCFHLLPIFTASLLPSLLQAGLSIFLFFPFLLRWLPLATPPWHKMAKTRGRGYLPVSFTALLLSITLLLSHIPSSDLQ